jgi:hypothetical protein
VPSQTSIGRATDRSRPRCTALAIPFCLLAVAQILAACDASHVTPTSLILPPYPSATFTLREVVPPSSTSPASPTPGLEPALRLPSLRPGQYLVTYRHAYVSDAGEPTPPSLRVISLDGDDLGLLATEVGPDATLSPDGTRIAYFSGVSQSWTYVTGRAVISPAPTKTQMPMCGHPQEINLQSASGEPCGSSTYRVERHRSSSTVGSSMVAVIAM